MPATLTAGTRLGPFEILSSLGEGGMGAVYRARDTKLNRDVAIKVLLSAVANDPERLARFQREAQVLASLNHPNIAHIHGLEDADGVTALVLELVEGPTLADRIALGPIPIDEALPIAKQIAEALEAAHEQGIIHRDLKPANIKVRSDGTVKILDFGLAKAIEPAAGWTPSMSMSPTITTPAMTQSGVILGTAAYMSPEQARGGTVDRRSDLWAFGVVLYEMLTGTRLFEGATVSDTLAAVLTKEPDWTTLPATTSAPIRKLLRRCLAKEHDHRLADVADARLELEDMTAADDLRLPPIGPARSRWLPLAFAAVVGASVAAAAMYGARSATPTAATAHLARLSILLPPGERPTTAWRAVAISPDGSRVVISTNAGVYLRALNGFELRKLPLDVNAGAGNIVFSPDGTRIANMSIVGVTTVDLATGAVAGLPLPRVDFAGVLGSLTWSDRGIVGAFGGGGIWLLPKGTTSWQQLVSLNPGEAASTAQLLPDHEHVLFTLLEVAAARRLGQVVLQTLASGARTILADKGSDARYVSDGYVLYVQNGALTALPFDVKTLGAAGAPVAVIDGVQSANILNGTMQFDVSDNGILAYLPGQPLPAAFAMDLVISDRQGKTEHLHLPPAPYETPRMSPDSQLFAVGTDDGREASVWVRDLDGVTEIRRLTIGSRSRFPVWSADGKRIAYQSDREGTLAIFSQAADGSDAPTRLTTPETGWAHLPESWSTTHLLFSAVRGEAVSLWALSLADRRASPLVGVTSTTPMSAVFSPDGRWIAYNVMANGHHTVYVRPFPVTQAVYEVSRNDDGHHPVWSRDGRELFFAPGPRQLLAVKVQFTPSFSFSSPVALAGAGLMGPGDTPRHYDILPDGARFIGRQVADDEETRAGGAPRIQVVTNLLEAIQRRR